MHYNRLMMMSKDKAIVVRCTTEKVTKIPVLKLFILGMNGKKKIGISVSCMISYYQLNWKVIKSDFIDITKCKEKHRYAISM